jgi:pimeloyl-ACP methyl ester carboxylesterase
MGGPPALLWASDHPDEVKGLVYIEAPVMLSEILTKIIAYTPETMKEGSMWWWIIPLAPDVPERLVVGNERAFLTWFYNRAARRSAIEAETVDEYLRTFSGREGVLGAMGVYRAAFVSMEETGELANRKVQIPVVALGGVKGLGAQVGEMLKGVVKSLDRYVIQDCGHFLPEECSNEVISHIQALTARAPRT